MCFCVSVNCGQRNMETSQNQINKLTLFVYSLSTPLFVYRAYSFHKKLRLLHPSILLPQPIAATRPLQAAHYTTFHHHGRQRHPGLCASTGCSSDYAIQRRPLTEGPGTRVSRTIPEICMRKITWHMAPSKPPLTIAERSMEHNLLDPELA